MADTKRKIRLWSLIAIGGAVGILLLVYLGAILRPTGYGEVRRAQTAVESEMRVELDRQIASAMALPRESGSRSINDRSRGNYRQLADADRNPDVHAPYSNELGSSPEHLLAFARGRYPILLHWEAFPATFDESTLETIQKELASPGIIFPLENELAYKSDFLMRDGPLYQTEWRFTHRALEGDQASAMEALAEWIRILRGSLLWEISPDEMYYACSRMLTKIAALDADAPEAAFALLNAFLEERSDSNLLPANKAARIDAAFESSTCKRSAPRSAKEVLSTSSTVSSRRRKRKCSSRCFERKWSAWPSPL